MLSPSLHDISFEMEFATLRSREASFAPPSKRVKGGWPHKTPAVKELSQAGFYYKPTCPGDDNTACFLCGSNLNGWEKDDNPIEEHLKHAESCGWAVLMSVESENQHDTSSMEDPTGQRLAEARKATFEVGWPHETKRGWTCKTDKMVEAGWYFAPSAESEDYVSCAYCKLSLDGWEPKDNPFDEHYSRSPSCPFFVFAGTTAPSKRPKAKKGRTSRASRTSKVSTRLSTQSNVTIQSEAASIPDLDESLDTSAVSLLSTASTATNKGKRKAGAGRTKTSKTKRTKTAKSKKDEEPETHADSQEETQPESVSYPSLQEQAEPEISEPQVALEMIDHEIIKDETPRAISTDQDAGPPELPTPTIPVSIESPAPKSSRRSQRKRSSVRSVVERQVQTPPPVVRSSPSQPSDVENAPPSTRPESIRPPLSSPGTIPPKWTAVDVDMVFESVSAIPTKHSTKQEEITDAERQMTVQEWIKHIADQAGSELRAEGERVVGMFEQEGQRALTVLEGIVCV